MAASSAVKILQHFTKISGFAKIATSAVVTQETSDLLQVKVHVTEDICNGLNTLHGGYTASMVDILSTVDLVRQGHSPGVSVDLSVQYLNAGMMDSTVLFESRLTKVGKKLAFCEVDVRDQESKKLLARGKHVKFLL